MPVIPTIQTNPGAVPSSGGQPRANPNLDVRAPADPFAASAAAATLEASAYQSTQRAGDRLADFGTGFANLYIKAKENVAAADWKSDLSRKLQEAEFESSKIPDRQKATADYDGRVTKIRDEFAASDVNPLIRSSVNETLPQQVDLRRAQTQNAAFNLESQAERGKLVTQLDGYNKMAADAPDPRLRDTIIEQANSSIDGRVSGGWMNAEQGARMKVDFKSNVLRTQIELAMAKDLRAGVALAGHLLPQLNAKDSRDIGVMTEDRKVQLKAETVVNDMLPVLGAYGNVGHWAGHIEGASTKTGVPAPLIAAVASQESSGNAGAVSPAGAEGPMQFMPATARDEGVVNPKDPAEAIPKGAGYLKKQLDKYGDKETALMAYNWGPGAVDKWIKEGRKAADVPAETRAYVSSVLRKEAQFAGAATGDALSSYRVAALKAEQDLLADNTMDPRLRSQALSILRQRSSTTNAIVLEERKAIDDEAETASIGLYTGKYKTGSFQTFADKYRNTGDNSKAAAYQFMADHESAFMDYGNQPPGAQRTMAALLPGAAGKIASSILADRRTDRTEFRRLGAEQERMFSEGLAGDVDPSTLIANAREAIQYYAAAGDAGKAKSLIQQFEGAMTGHKLAQLPPAQREAALNQMRELAQSPDGLSVRDATVIRQIQKGATKSAERWDNDPLGINNDRGAIRLQPFDQKMDGVNLSLWATQRYRDVVQTQLDKNPNAQNVQIPYFTQSEMSEISGQLAKGNVQSRQQFLARLGSAVPASAVPLIGQQMAKNDALSDSWAAAMGLYARNKPGDTAIADSVVAGANLLAEGGPDGKLRIQLNRETFSQIDTQLGASRAGMDARDVALQNNAVAARYVALTASAKDHSSLDADKLNQAIKDIVGTAMTMNGGQFILPREIEPYQFRDGVAAINEGDVAGLQPAADGRPITAEKVRRYGTYQSVGDGLYKVRMPDPRNGGTSELRDAYGNPWVLDIRPFIARDARTTGQVSDPARDMLGVLPGRAPVPLVRP